MSLVLSGVLKISRESSINNRDSARGDDLLDGIGQSMWRTTTNKSIKKLHVYIGAAPMENSAEILQSSSVQSLSRVRLFPTPWIAARQASLSITNSHSSPKLMSIESVMPSSHLTLCPPLLLLGRASSTIAAMWHPPRVRCQAADDRLSRRAEMKEKEQACCSTSSKHHGKPRSIHMSIRRLSKRYKDTCSWSIVYSLHNSSW